MNTYLYIIHPFLLHSQELFETAKDVTKTLEIAVGILADLMTFNKIESGILQLTKSVVPIKTYVHEVVDAFAAGNKLLMCFVLVVFLFSHFFSIVNKSFSN